MNEEILAKLKELKEAKSVEEILTIAKRNGREVTAEEAQAAFDALHGSGELSDDDLAKVAGGVIYKTAADARKLSDDDLAKVAGGIIYKK